MRVLVGSQGSAAGTEMTVPQLYPTSLDAAIAGPRPLRRPLEGDRAVDACVVGGGFTGLSAALALAEQGCSVVVLEAERVGHGASGRSGGQLWSGHRRGVLELEALLGRDATRALWQLAEEARALLAARIARHRIACSEGTGTLLAASRRRHLDALRTEAEHLARWYDAPSMQVLGRAEVCDAVATRRYHGGLYDPGGGHVHPLSLVLGLAAAAEEAGVEVLERSPVERIDWNLRTALHTPRGSVRARYALLCAHLANARLVPALAPHMAPVASAQVATEPLDGPSPIPAGCCVCSTDALPEYFRVSADGRLVFGAGERFGSRAIVDPTRLARPRLLRVFPQLEGVRIEHAWTGHVAVTRDRLPRFGRVAPNGLYAHGFCGHGVVLSQIAGQLLAEAVAGEAERFDLLARLPVRGFAALGPLTRPAAALVLLAQALRAWP